MKPDLEKLKALLEKVDGGRWYYDSYRTVFTDANPVLNVDGENEHRVICTADRESGPPERNDTLVLIAEAKNQLPALIARVEELESLLAEAKPFVGYEAYVPDLLDRIRAALNQGEAK